MTDTPPTGRWTVAESDWSTADAFVLVDPDGQVALSLNHRGLADRIAAALNGEATPAPEPTAEDIRSIVGERDALMAMVDCCRELVVEMDNGDPNDDLTLGWRDALADIVGYPQGYRSALTREADTDG